MTKRGLLIVFSGPSGVGKDTVLGRFLLEDKRCVRSVSATTREPREGEIDGRDYHFMSQEKFGELVARGEMLEYTKYGGNDHYYGTPKKAVENQLARGLNVVLKIEVEGAMDIKKQRPDAVLVFLSPPDWNTLRARLENRASETPEVLERRLATAKYELSFASQYDYVLVNHQVEHCCQDLSAVVTAAGHATKNMTTFLKGVMPDA
jgi:guanylate kinase